MNMLHNLRIVMIFMLMASCSHPPAKVEWPDLPPGFFTDENKFSHSKKKTGVPKVFTKLVVGEGNGLFGHQSFIVDEKNVIEVRLFDEKNKRLAHAFKAQLYSDKPVVKELLSSLNLGELWQSYRTEFGDGPGAILAITGENKEVYRCWMSNYFPPEFRKLWTRIQRLVSKTPTDHWLYSGRVRRSQIYDKYMRTR